MSFLPQNRMQADLQFDPGQHICVQNHSTARCHLHWHNYFEIELVTAGTGKHILNGTEHTISKGSAYFMTPTDFHELIADEPVELINISFDECALTEQLLADCLSIGSGKFLTLTGEEFERILTTAKLLQHECRTDGPCTRQLCEYLLSSLLRSGGEAFRSSADSEHLKGINRAIAYLELHFREPITLALLAEQAGFNPTYFSELFRRITGQTYTQRLNALRIGYAQTLLSRGLPVSDACYASGFGSVSNFLTTFKAYCRMTPSQYKKLRQNDIISTYSQERTC